MFYDPLHEHLKMYLVFLYELNVVLGEPATTLQERSLDIGIKMLKCVTELSEIVVGAFAGDSRRGQLHLHEIYGVVGQEDAMDHLVVGDFD